MEEKPKKWKPKLTNKYKREHGLLKSQQPKKPRGRPFLPEEEKKPKPPNKKAGRPEKLGKTLNITHNKQSAEYECEIAYNAFQREIDLEKTVPNAVFGLLITLPEKPKDITKIVNYALPYSERKFPYYSKKFKRDIDLIEDLDEPVTFESQTKKQLKIHHNGRITKEDFLKSEWDKIKNGFWFFNGNKLEYITGGYYFILQYWMIPNDLKGGISTNPEFVDMIRDRHYVFERLMKDSNYAGLVYLGCRRSGKTIDGIGLGYLDTISQQNGNFTIQSKTNKDAKKVFAKLIKSWKKLPKFLKPEDTGDANPTSGLHFDHTRTRTTKRIEKEYYEVLEGTILFYESSSTAVDGDRTTFQFHDEIGKTLAANVAERLEISRVCCYSGTKIIGFMFWTSTVEEMEKGGGKNAKKIWDDADPNRLTDNGRTQNTLGRLFFPAYYGMFDGEDEDTGLKFIDEFGYSRIDLAKKWLDAEERGKDEEALSALRRKYPQHISDCFRSAEGASPFNKTKLKAHKIYNEDNPFKTPKVRGNFEWVNGVPFTEVVFIPCDNGRWELFWMPPKEMRNKYSRDPLTGHYKPDLDLCISSVDPFAAAKLKDDSKGSKAAALVFTQHADFQAPTVVCLYNYRHDSPNKMYEDMLMQSIFYSSPLMPERNKGAIVDWFDEKGFLDFIMLDPFSPSEKEIRGTFTDGSNNFETMIGYAMAYVSQHVGSDEVGNFKPFPYNELIDDLLNFEPTNRTKYDLTMAFIIGITAVHNKRRKFLGRQTVINKDFDRVEAWI